MAWLKIRHDLLEDPAVIAMAAKLGIDEFAVAGRLLKFWAWGDNQTIDGNALGVTKTFIDRYVSATGFGDALEAVGWLIVTAEGITIPNFDRHISESAKARALAAERQKTHKAKSNALSNGDSVTSALPSALPDKRREDKSKNNNNPLPPLAVPAELQTPEFMTAWESWKKFRSEIKKPMSPQTVALQLRDFAKLGSRESVAQIQQSIRNGWQGLFEVKTNEPKTSGPSSTVADARRSAARAAEWHDPALDVA